MRPEVTHYMVKATQELAELLGLSLKEVGIHA